MTRALWNIGTAHHIQMQDENKFRGPYLYCDGMLLGRGLGATAH